MKELEQLIAKIKAQIESWGRILRQKLFGNNNETLDFLMDSFYRLSPEQRSAVIVGSGVSAVLLCLGVLWLYFNRVDALEAELNRGFNSLHELRSLKREYETQLARYNQLITAVSGKSSSLRVKPFFEEKAQTLGLELQGLNDKTEAMTSDNPLSSKMQYVRVEMRLSKISIPRLLSFLTDVEKSNYFLSVKDLAIRSRYGTKLFFDADVEFRGYSVTSAPSEEL